MNIPRELRYTSTHEWVRVKGGVATVGITDYAQQQLSDITYVELPDLNDEVNVSDEVAFVESVKAASDVYAPVSGTIVEVNSAVAEEPDRINRDPYGDGWLFKIRMKNPKEVASLLDADAYEEQLPPDEEE
ncbi:MAG: glycine cleavage system protein GcvH [Kiritimatiellae bacterium]|nr:glycine cleavage system protein GcvH [Kiritimatiellia bacterium]